METINLKKVEYLPRVMSSKGRKYFVARTPISILVCESCLNRILFIANEGWDGERRGEREMERFALFSVSIQIKLLMVRSTSWCNLS